MCNVYYSMILIEYYSILLNTTPYYTAQSMCVSDKGRDAHMMSKFKINKHHFREEKKSKFISTK